MIGERSCFIKLEENINSKIALGDNKVQKVEGRDTITIRTKNG